MERKIVPDSIVYTDSWRGYNVVDVLDLKHFRINHSELFAGKQNHINRIEPCIAYHLNQKLSG